jgi:hypothetical protein
MDALEMVDALARRARTEVAPRTDISVVSVLAAVRREEKLSPFAWSAGISALAACVVLSVALHTQKSTRTDSIEPLFQAAEVQMP